MRWWNHMSRVQHVFQNNNSAGSPHDLSNQKEGMAKHRNDRWEALQRGGFIPENPKLEKWCALSTGREGKCRHTNKNSKNEVQLSLCNKHASSYSSQRLLQTFTLIKYIGQPTVRCLLSENISIENVTEEEVERSYESEDQDIPYVVVSFISDKEIATTKSQNCVV